MTLAVRIEPEELNFGRVIQGESKRGAFSLINDSSNPVQVEAVRTSCGCLELDKSPFTIPPASRVDVPVRLNTRFREGQQALNVFFRLGAAPEHGLPTGELGVRIAADIRKEFWPVPDAIDFGRIEPGVWLHQDIELHGVTPRAWQPTLGPVTGGNDADEWRVEANGPETTAGSSCRLRLSLRAANSSGRRDALVALRPFVTDELAVTLPVRYECASSFSVTPFQVVLISGSGRADMSRVKIRPVAVGTRHTLRVGDAPDWCRVNVAAVDSGVDLAVKLHEPLTAGTVYRGVIRLTAEPPAGPPVEIPVTAVVAP